MDISTPVSDWNTIFCNKIVRVLGLELASLLLIFSNSDWCETWRPVHSSVCPQIWAFRWFLPWLTGKLFHFSHFTLDPFYHSNYSQSNNLLLLQNCIPTIPYNFSICITTQRIHTVRCIPPSTYNIHNYKNIL